MVSSIQCTGSERSVPAPTRNLTKQVQSLKPGNWTPAKYCRQTYTHMNDISSSQSNVPLSERIFGTQLIWKPTIPTQNIRNDKNLPLRYILSEDCRFSNACIDNGFDRVNCGNDWAAAVAAVIGDQYALKFNLNYVPQISAARLTSLFTDDTKDGCICKVSLNDVARLLSQGSSPTPNPSSGAMLRSCWPETMITNFTSKSGANASVKGKDMEKLRDCCWNCCEGNVRGKSIFMVNSMYPIYVKQGDKIDSSLTQDQIKLRLLNRQPVCTSFVLSESFTNYWLKTTTKRPLKPDPVDPNTINKETTGVSCVILGYGVDKRNDTYWIIQTSMRRPDNSFIGAVYASSNGSGNGLDFPLVGPDGLYIGGPWALTLVDKFVPGIHNTDYPVYNDATKFSAKKNINWLYVSGILIAGLVIVLMIVFLM